jgi:hypothetical protein
VAVALEDKEDEKSFVLMGVILPVPNRMQETPS